MPDITRSFTDFPKQNAYRHALRPGGRESLAHVFVFPEDDLAGFIYPSIRDDGTGKVRIALFGPALEHPVLEEVEAIVPLDMDFDNWRLPPFRMAVEDPHKRVALEWEGNKIKFRGIYSATFPVYAFSAHPLGVPAYYGDDRTEQHGNIRGTIEVGGISKDVVGWMARDHSWGPRIWGLNQHYKWFHASTEDVSVHFFEMFSFGRRELRGYLMQHGIMRHIADVDYTFDLDDKMMQRTFKAHVTDTDGRSVDIDCTTLGNIQLGFDPNSYLNEAAVTLEIAGKRGAGWVEFCWNRNYFDFAKDYVEQYG